jgi:hypothetical protein
MRPRNHEFFIHELKTLQLTKELAWSPVSSTAEKLLTGWTSG